MLDSLDNPFSTEEGLSIRERFEQVICPGCQYRNTRPITLECGHSFCQKCIGSPEYNQFTTQVMCPTCRIPTDAGKLRINEIHAPQGPSDHCGVREVEMTGENDSPVSSIDDTTPFLHRSLSDVVQEMSEQRKGSLFSKVVLPVVVLGFISLVVYVVVRNDAHPVDVSNGTTTECLTPNYAHDPTTCEPLCFGFPGRQGCNDHGNCVGLRNSAECSCDKGWDGADCSNPALVVYNYEALREGLAAISDSDVNGDGVYTLVVGSDIEVPQPLQLVADMHVRIVGRLFHELGPGVEGDVRYTLYPGDENSGPIFEVFDEATLELSGLRLQGTRDSAVLLQGWQDMATPSLLVDSCDFVDNHAETGGALYATYADVSLRDCYFEGNDAVWGGAIYRSAGSLSINTTTFVHNTADRGSVIYEEVLNEDGAPHPPIHVLSSRFLCNAANNATFFFDNHVPTSSFADPLVTIKGCDFSEPQEEYTLVLKDETWWDFDGRECPNQSFFWDGVCQVNCKDSWKYPSPK
eukprot:Rmarinus@m.17230